VLVLVLVVVLDSSLQQFGGIEHENEDEDDWERRGEPP
jgi:hypothetical protein